MSRRRIAASAAKSRTSAESDLRRSSGDRKNKIGKFTTPSSRVKSAAGAVRKLRDAIEEYFEEIIGEDVRVEHMRSKGTLFHRVYIVSKAFKNISYSERQQIVWNMVSKALTPTESLYISMVMGLTPSEYKRMTG